MRILVFMKRHDGCVAVAAGPTTRLGRRRSYSVYQVNNVPDGLTVEESLEKVAEMPLPRDGFQFDWPE